MDEISEALWYAATEWKDLRSKTEDARRRLAEVIRREVAAGTKQVDIVKATGYTREQVRRIVAGPAQ